MSIYHFYAAYALTIVLTRVYLKLHPHHAPKWGGFQPHHYMIGIVFILVYLFVPNLILLGIGIGLVVDEIPLFFVFRGLDWPDDHWKQYHSMSSILAIVGISILATLTLLPSQISIQFPGILLEILGAFYLARALIFKTSQNIRDEAHGLPMGFREKVQMPPGFADRLVNSYGASVISGENSVIESMETKIGFGLVACGLIIEAVGLLDPSVLLPIRVAATILLAVWCISELTRNSHLRHSGAR